MNTFNDQEILKAIRTGNNDWVLSNLYKEILPRIKKLILKNNGSEEDAKDIFQDVVLILYNQVKLNKFDEEKQIGGFMYTVARNLWINKAKRSNRFAAIRDTEHVYVAQTDILNDIIDTEKTNAIDTALDKVGEECKKLLKYSIYEKLSMKEIAVKMGYSSESIAKTYNYRCKQKLVNFVKENPYIISLFKE